MDPVSRQNRQASPWLAGICGAAALTFDVDTETVLQGRMPRLDHAPLPQRLPGRGEGAGHADRPNLRKRLHAGRHPWRDRRAGPAAATEMSTARKGGPDDGT